MAEASAVPPAQMIVAAEKSYIAAKTKMESQEAAFLAAKEAFEAEQVKMREAAEAFVEAYGSYMPKAKSARKVSASKELGAQAVLASKIPSMEA